MAETTGVHIVEIRAGDSQRPLLELRPGVVVQPLSIGRVGMWSVDAPGVLDVHAYVYFDGRALFLQSADAGNPAKGNGQAIGTAWQQIEIPCTIEIGRARLVYRTLDEVDEDGEEDKTIAQPIQLPPRNHAPPQYAPNAGAFSNRKGPDSDATRLAPMPAIREPDPTVVSPLEMGPTPMGGVPKARPAAGMPAWDGSPSSSPTQIGAPPQAPAPPPPQTTGYQAFGSVQVAVPAPPPAPPMMMGGNPMGQTLQAPMQSPLMQPGYGGGMMMQPPTQPMMQPAMQPGMQPGMYPPPGGSGPIPPMQMMQGAAETGRIQSPSELKGWPKAVAEWKAMPPLRKFIIGTFPGVALLVYFMLFDTPPPRPRPPQIPSASASASASEAPTGSTSAVPTSSATDVPTVVATGSGPVPTATATSTATAPTTSATAKPPLAKGKKTPEREAFELVGQGQYAKAAAVYEQLAQDHPEQPAYREAARLLRLRATGN